MYKYMTEFQKPPAYKNTTTSETTKGKINSNGFSSVVKSQEGFFVTLGKTLFGE
jgi:hypothetical protein